MACLNATGAACANADGSPGHAPYSEVLFAPVVINITTTATTYTLEWLAGNANEQYRIYYRYGTTADFDIVTGVDTTLSWTSPTVDMSQEQLVAIRAEDITAGEKSPFAYIAPEELHYSLHFGVPDNSYYYGVI